MQPTDDGTLLRQYAENHSDEAFAALVTRHVNLVYSVALRHVGDSHQAEEVAQAVFILLAKKAGQLRHDKALSSWLFQATRLTANNLARSETRRHRREQEAHMQSVLNESGSDLWPRIAPLLDDAVAGLSEADRHAIVLRFYEGRNLREVGTALGASEDAAEKRVNRAVEKLRTFFGKRGVTVGASGLVVVISANAVQAAPVGLAVTISTAASLAGATIATTASATAIAATKAIAMTTLQETLITATVAVLAGVGLYQVRQNSQLSEQVRALQEQQSPLVEHIQQLQASLADATNRQVALLAETSRLMANRPELELLKLRGEVTRLKASEAQRQNNPMETDMKTWLERIAKIKQRLSETPSATIPEMRLLDEEAYKDATAHSTLSTERDYLAAMSNLRSAAEFEFITQFLNPALTQYSRANGGRFPADLSQLQPYFPSPVEAGILDRWEIVPANKVRTDNFGDPIITTKAAIDPDIDARYAVGLNGFASAGLDTAGHNGWGMIAPEVILAPAFRAAADAYAAAHNGQKPDDRSEILPYLNLTTEGQRAAWEKLRIWNQKR